MSSPSRADVRELESFVAVAEHLSFSRAARSLHLTQPPLTRHIQSLEARLGCRLLERSTHAVSLTDAGRLFLEDARAVLGILDRSALALRRARDGAPLRLRLAFVGALLDDPLVHLLQQFRDSHPHCQLQLSDLAPGEQQAALLAGEIDGGFIGALPARPAKDLDFTVWREEELLLAVPSDHRLALQEDKRVPWRSLQSESWVLVSSGAAPAFRHQFSSWCVAAGLQSPRIVQESSRVTAILTMVAVGAGITIVPEGARHLFSRGVTFRRLGRPLPVLQHSFAWRSGTDREASALKEFLTLLSRPSQPRVAASRRSQ